MTMEEFVKSLFEYTVMAKILQLEVKCDVTNNIEQGFFLTSKIEQGYFINLFIKFLPVVNFQQFGWYFSKYF